MILLRRAAIESFNDLITQPAFEMGKAAATLLFKELQAKNSEFKKKTLIEEVKDANGEKGEASPTPWGRHPENLYIETMQ